MQIIFRWLHLKQLATFEMSAARTKTRTSDALLGPAVAVGMKEKLISITR